MTLTDRIAQCNQWQIDGVTTPEALEEARLVAEAAREQSDQLTAVRGVLVFATLLFVATRHAESRTVCAEALELASGLDHPSRVEALILMARIEQGASLDRSLALIEEAFAVTNRIGTKPLPGLLLHAGEIYAYAARYHEAMALLRRAEHAFDVQNSPRGRLSALNRITNLLIETGDHEAALEHGLEALDIANAEGHIYLQGQLKKRIAYALTALGRFAEAFSFGRDALGLAQTVNNVIQIADCHGTLGDILLRVGDHRGALTEFSIAFGLYQQKGTKKGEGVALAAIGRAYAAAGDDEQARDALERSVSLLSAVSHHSLVLFATLDLVAVLLRLQEIDRAEQQLNDAIKEIQPEDLRPDVLDALGACARAKGNAETAERFVRRASMLRRRERATDDAILDRFRDHVRNAQQAAMPRIEDLLAENRGQNMESVSPLTAHRAPLTDPVTPLTAHRAQLADPVAPHAAHRVRTFGAFEVVIDGEVVSTERWKRKKARDVFKYLIARYRTAVTADEIITALWGEDAEIEACLPTLQNATSAIRTALEPGLKPRQSSQYLSFRDGAYILDLGRQAVVDLESFKYTIHAAHAASEPDERMRLLIAATDLVHGDFLPDDKYEPWTAPIRDAMKSLCIEALTELAERSFERGDHAAGVTAAHRVLEMDDTYEEVYEVVLQNLTAEGRLADAERIYEQCRRAFQREYGTEPPAWLAAYVREGASRR
jgi:DNA-binding SARP family transcriptional activator